MRLLDIDGDPVEKAICHFSDRARRRRSELEASALMVTAGLVVSCKAMLQSLQQPIDASFGGPVGAQQSVEMQVDQAAMQIGRSA